MAGSIGILDAQMNESREQERTLESELSASKRSLNLLDGWVSSYPTYRKRFDFSFERS